MAKKLRAAVGRRMPTDRPTLKQIDSIPAKTPRLPDGRPDWLTQCTKLCGAACCRYIGVPIEAPTCARDWDDWRWYLSHEGISIYKDSGQWYLNVETRCGHLTPELTCAIYETRPETCAEYDPSACEWQDPEGVWEIHFSTHEELEAYLRKKKNRRNAQARKRRAAAARKPSRNGRRRGR